MWYERMPKTLFVLQISILFFGGNVHGQENPAQPDIRVESIRGGLFLVTGSGGNMTAFLGEDGGFLVDAGYLETAGDVKGKIRESVPGAGTPAAFEYLVNTHWHFDHTGGNPAFAEDGATIIAHENVSRLVSEDQSMAALDGLGVEALPPIGRPTLTFNDRISLEWNGDMVHMVHMPAAHSDGDVIVHFRDADVIHLGDLFFNGMYPFIDVDHRGNIGGMVTALEEVLAHSRPTTLFVPGHGPLADRAGLESYLSMMRTVRDRVLGMIEEGMSRDEVMAAEPTAEYDDTWGGQGGFTDPGIWVGLVYDGISRAQRLDAGRSTW